jgi:hypothetical protein
MKGIQLACNADDKGLVPKQWKRCDAVAVIDISRWPPLSVGAGHGHQPKSQYAFLLSLTHYTYTIGDRFVAHEQRTMLTTTPARLDITLPVVNRSQTQIRLEVMEV